MEYEVEYPKVLNNVTFENNEVTNCLNNISNLCKNRNKNDFDFIVELVKLSQLGYYTQSSGELTELAYHFKTGSSSYYQFIRFYDLVSYFGLARKTVEMLVYIGKKFIDWSDNTPKWIIDDFNKMTIYKIAEFRSLTVAEINELIKNHNNICSWSCGSIRLAVKRLKAEQNQESFCETNNSTQSQKNRKQDTICNSSSSNEGKGLASLFAGIVDSNQLKSLASDDTISSDSDEDDIEVVELDIDNFNFENFHYVSEFKLYSKKQLIDIIMKMQRHWLYGD